MVYKRQFSRPTIGCRKDYMKPCIRENDLDNLMFRIRTSDVSSNKKSKCIGESNVCLANKMKTSKLDINISSNITRNDNCNKMLMEVNSYLKDLCKSNDIPVISKGTISPKIHLNNSRLYLNIKNSYKRRDNFVRYLKALTS